MNALTPATRRGSLMPTNLDEAWRFAETLAQSDFAPKDYRGKPANILIAMQWGQEIGLNPLQAIQNIAVVNGKPAIYGDAAMALVRASPVCDDVIETIAGEGMDRAATCEARRKGKAPVVTRFSMADAKRAGLLGKQGPWTNYPDRMLQMRARGFALRDAFPDVLRGVITAEEAHDYPTEPAPAVVGLAVPDQPALPAPEPAPALTFNSIVMRVEAFEDQLAGIQDVDHLRGWLAEEKTQKALAWLREPPERTLARFSDPDAARAQIAEAEKRVRAKLDETWARLLPPEEYEAEPESEEEG